MLPFLSRQADRDNKNGNAATENSVDASNIISKVERHFWGVTGFSIPAIGIAAGLDRFGDKDGTLAVALAAGVRVFALSLAFAAACTMSGWLLGLLFGIPRTSGRPPANGGANTASPAAPSGTAAHDSAVNTNLEDISDWLTKTIVGVGLTQLNAVPGYLWQAADLLNKHGFGWPAHGRLLGLALFFFFTAGGFWLGYITTRTYVTELLRRYNRPSPNAVALAKAPENLQLGLDGQGIASTADQSELARADQDLLRRPLHSLSSSGELAAWGAAQARSGEFAKARVALQEALNADPGRTDIRQLLATATAAAGDREGAASLSQESELAVLNALYKDQPDGFREAISVGEKLLAAGKSSANLHIWLASAYGQQYAYEAGQKAASSMLDAIRANLLREIKAALGVDPGARRLLRSLWQPQPGSQEDDLASLPKDDPDLVALLGE